MKCHNCSINELEYEVLVEGEKNTSLMTEIEQHLHRMGFTASAHKNSVSIHEEGIHEFKDFCVDHMDSDLVKFRIGDQEWQPIEQVDAVFEMQWVDEVIKNHLINCHYQPIVNQNEKVMGYELLARFKGQNGEIIFPGDIFNAARNRGRLYALDRVCRMAAVKHSAQVKHKKAFINFIPTSIYSPEHCLRTTIQLAYQLDINPSQLVFEVVETDRVEDHNHLKSILNYYKERGFHYALDDVGEGYSTLELLEDIEPSYMKLDMKFVQDVSSDTDKQRVAKSFLQKAKQVNAVPLAEGVEEVEDFKWLKAEGYELFQGYLFGKPAPQPQIPAKIFQ